MVLNLEVANSPFLCVNMSMCVSVPYPLSGVLLYM